jgi:hypothetical protein
MRPALGFVLAVILLAVALVVLLMMTTPAAAQTRAVPLFWLDNSGEETSFILQRRTGHCLTPTGTYADLVTLPPGTEQYIDSTSPLPYACYRIRATSGSGDSPQSNEAGTSLPQRQGRRGLSRR